MEHWRLWFGVGVVVIITGGAVLYFAPHSLPTPGPMPSENPISGNSLAERNIQYPSSLSLTYIHTVDWPPQIHIVSEPFTCTEAGNELSRAGATRKATLHERTYCITTVTDGAAGSVYRQFAYSFAFDNQTAVLTFSLRYPQCLNYDPTERTECEAEQARFVVDMLVGDMLAIAEQTDADTVKNNQRYLFACPTGNLFTIAYSGENNQNANIFFNGTPYVLYRALSASGARYATTNEHVVFWEHAGTARIELDGEVSVEGCTPVPEATNRQLQQKMGSATMAK